MSDWAGIKKAINSDLSTPLNHLMWLNDYRIFGEESDVFQNKGILHELYGNYKLCMNTSSIQTEAFDYVVTNNTEVGKALASIKGIYNADTIAQLTTVEEVVSTGRAMRSIAANETATKLMLSNEVTSGAIVNNETAMAEILNSETAWSIVFYNEATMPAIVNSETYMNQVLGNDECMNSMLNSAIAINAVAKGTSKWTTAFKKNFFTAINDSTERIKSIYRALKNTAYFSLKIQVDQDAVSGLNQYATAEYAANGLITGYIGSYSGYNTAWTNLFIDGEQVASKQSKETPSTSKLKEETVNAIACPVATFTETGDGYAAIQVYIAK